jgi:hypothetical protein
VSLRRVLIQFVLISDSLVNIIDNLSVGLGNGIGSHSSVAVVIRELELQVVLADELIG